MNRLAAIICFVCVTHVYTILLVNLWQEWELVDTKIKLLSWLLNTGAGLYFILPAMAVTYTFVVLSLFDMMFGEKKRVFKRKDPIEALNSLEEFPKK